MQKALSLTDTTIGKKAVLALTGLVLFGFVVGHMIGNLQVFAGPEKLNGYAAMLKGTPPLLWGTRIVLLVSVIAHVVISMQLVSRSMAARPVGYRKSQDLATTYAAKTMKLSGPIVLLFIIFHLAHFTAPGLDFNYYEHSHLDVYNNFVQSFSQPWISGVYIVAQVLLGMHLSHGLWSLLQTLGLSHPRYDAKRRLGAHAFAALIVIGNISMPIAVLAGIIKPA